jgi:ferredoxin
MRITTTAGGAVNVTVDKGLCASSSACVFSDPQVFELDEDDESRVIPGAPPTSEASLREIAYNCPAGAITVESL